MSRFRALVAVAAGFACPAAATSTPLPGTGTTRLAGADRFETAVEVSKSTFTAPQPVVFVASGEVFADALAAGPAAASADAPILLVKQDNVPDVVAAELDRLAPSHLVIVGGPAAISDATMVALATHASTIERVSGDDRYATAEEVLKGMGGVESVYLASGTGFADALAGGAAAAAEEGGLLLTAKGALPPATERALTVAAPSHVVILGGTGAVSNAVEQKVKTLLPDAVVDRADGSDRFETAAILAAALWGDTGAQTAFLSSGTDYPDALSATPVAYVNDAPIVLTRATCTPEVTDVVLSEILQPDITVYLGGTGVTYQGSAIC